MNWIYIINDFHARRVNSTQYTVLTPLWKGCPETR